MRNSNRGGGNYGGNRSFGGRGGNRSFDRRDSEREMFSVVCDECGRDCEVPFKPSSDKPVFCSECFSERKPDGDRNDRRGNRDRGGNRSFGRSNRREDKQMYGAICDSCGKDCEVPFRPTSGKPVLCDNCFKSDKRSSRDSNGSSGGNKQELANINAKLDYIVKALEQLSVLPKTIVNNEEKSVKKDAKKSTPVKVKSKAKKADAEIEEVTQVKPKKAPAKKKATAKKKK